jgi:hypothetical protein
MPHYNNHRANMRNNTRYTVDEQNYDDEWYADERRPRQALATRTNPYANRSGVRFDDRIYDEERRSHQLAPRVSQSASSRTYPTAYHSGPYESEDEMMLRQMGRMDLRQMDRRGSEDEMLLRQMGRMDLRGHRSGEGRSRQYGDRSHPYDGREASDYEFGPLVQSRESEIRSVRHHQAQGSHASSGCVHPLHSSGGASGQVRCHCPCHVYDADEEVTLTFTSRRRGF